MHLEAKHLVDLGLCMVCCTASHGCRVEESSFCSKGWTLLCRAEQQLRRSWRAGGSGYPGSLESLWVLSKLPRALQRQERGPACARLRALPAAYLAGARCHLAAVAGLSVPGKQLSFPIELQPSNCFSREDLHNLPPQTPEWLVQKHRSGCLKWRMTVPFWALRVWPCFATRQVIHLPSRWVFYRRRRLGKSQKQLNETSALLGWLPYWQMGVSSTRIFTSHFWWFWPDYWNRLEVFCQ